MQRMILVADVGGTHARLALCHLDTGELSQIGTYVTVAFPSLEAVIRQYLTELQIEIYAACIAIACPITDDWVAMTNHNWAFSIDGMKASLGLTHLAVINDFIAVSMAIPMLSKQDVVQLGGGEAQQEKPIAVYGAGTGLGVAHLVQVNCHWISLPGEGGHVDFAANTEQEADILSILRAELGHVSAERILSGAGLVNLYRALVIAEQRLPAPLSPQEITERALANSCPDCYRTLSLFCVILGRFGGNLALNLATFGGCLYCWRDRATFYGVLVCFWIS